MYLAVVAVALTASSLATAVPPGPVYSPAQLARIVDPKPTVAGWTFSRVDSYIYPIPAHDPAFTLQEWLLANKPTARQRAFATKFSKAGFVIGRQLAWKGDLGPGHKHPNFVVFAWLFRTVAGAQAASTSLRSPGLTRTSGLGSDAWAASGNKGAALLWRRGNLVAYMSIDCDDSDCGFRPVAPALHAYATQLYGRATQVA
jgi:hypothetical protein